MTPTFIFATGIENSYPTIRMGMADVSQSSDPESHP